MLLRAVVDGYPVYVGSVIKIAVFAAIPRLAGIARLERVVFDSIGLLGDPIATAVFVPATLFPAIALAHEVHNLLTLISL